MEQKIAGKFRVSIAGELRKLNFSQGAVKPKESGDFDAAGDEQNRQIIMLGERANY